jgi:hypothetical protein
MREHNFFWSFKMTLNIHFLSESTSVKVLKQKILFQIDW